MAINQLGNPVGYTYHYDQLNRLKKTRQHTGISGTNWDSSSITLNYQENATYDGNGNILTYGRNGAAPTAQTIDSLTYNYNRTNGRLINNRLQYITDAVANSNYSGDITNQTNSSNYRYDITGNLIYDVQSGITGNDGTNAITWSVYGKIQSIYKTTGTISYTYDPSGQRVSKTAGGLTSYYIRDAQGNTLAIYDNAHSNLNWKEQQLYGSSRLGLWVPNENLASNNAIAIWDTTGNKSYELDNHLGNVLATIPDKRLQHTTNNTTIDYYNADVSTAQDYYPFGMLMPGRQYSFGNVYRYGFNGKENDNEVKGMGNEIDYGARIYDPRRAGFDSVDPMATKYPWYTPYQFSGNSPIGNVDLDGKEDEPFWKQLLSRSIGYGPQPQNANEAIEQSNERAAVAQVGATVNKMYNAEENTLGIVPGMAAFFEYGRGNNKTAASYLILDIFGDELLRYAGKGIKYLRPEELFKVEVNSVELFGKASEEGEFITTKFKDIGKVSERAWYKYQEQINGKGGSVEYLKKGINGFVKFDGFKNGVLLEAKSQYQWLFKTGRATEEEIYEKMSQQLGRQVTAAAGTKLEWHFAEKETMEGLENYLKNEGRGDLLNKVDLIYTPAKK